MPLQVRSTISLSNSTSPFVPRPRHYNGKITDQRRPEQAPHTASPTLQTRQYVSLLPLRTSSAYLPTFSMALLTRTVCEPPRKRHCPGLGTVRLNDSREIIGKNGQEQIVQPTDEHIVYSGSRVRRQRPAASCTDPEICFGMLIDIPIKAVAGQATTCDYSNTPAYLTSHKKLRRASDGTVIGRLYGHYARSFPTLAAEDGVKFEFSCSLNPEIWENQERGRSDILYASAIIYGPNSISDDMAAFMKRCGYFLQEPVGCSRNVPYKNPQCLPPLEPETLMTFDVSAHRRQCGGGLPSSSADFLDKITLQSTEDIPWADAPSALATKLHPHQHQALTFFQRKEMGFKSDAKGHGIWELKADLVKPTFTNTINGTDQQDPPPEFRGGILADEMGLGKTLSMIALITSDKERGITSPDGPATSPGSMLRTDKYRIRSTLVIVPPSLLATWEDQFLLHLVPQTVTWARHHERQRFSLNTAANPPDIVLTTYSTVVSEYKKLGRETSSIFSLHWHRIILDEAHRVRNWSTATAKATSALSATCRWAVTGTPIQNGLQDLVGLLKFIRAHPYDNERRFDADVINLWRENRAPEAIERIRKLVNCVMIRRQKTVIQLPPRRNDTFRVEFSQDEMLRYQMVEQPVIKAITGTEEPVQYATVLQQINKLRMICNIGTALADEDCPEWPHTPVAPMDDALAGLQFEDPSSAVEHVSVESPMSGKDRMTGNQDTPSNVELADNDAEVDDHQALGSEESPMTDDMAIDDEDTPEDCEEEVCPDMVTTRLAMEDSCCERCQKSLKPPDPDSEATDLDVYPHYAACLNLYCGDCALNYVGCDTQCACGLPNVCILKPILPNMMQSYYLKYGQRCLAGIPTSTTHISSKVRAVISNIRKHIDEKNVVFSYWRSSLDMVQAALADVGIRFVRLDGSFTHDSRKNSLEAFRNEADIKVVLLTISCGAVGLDLTAASRVHLLEPQWNPTVEDQAFARVHRMGQTRSVTTIRYIVRDSFEEHVIEVRDRKKFLADLLLAKEKSMDQDLNHARLQRFLSLLRR